MDEAVKSLENNTTWTATNLPEDQIIVGCKWLCKMKYIEICTSG